MIAADLAPPHSLEAEQGVLGGLMLDNDAWDLIADKVTADDFFRREHRIIFQNIGKLANEAKPFDPVTLSDAIKEVGKVGGLAYLGELAKNTPSVANIGRYAEIVANRAHLRRLISFSWQSSREASDPQADATQVQELLEQQLYALGQNHQNAEFVNLKEALLGVIDQIDENFNSGNPVRGLPTGLDDLDKMTGGLQDADLIILAARPSMGKTSLALNFVDAALQKATDKSVQIYSLEMPARALIYRMLAILGHVDLERLLSGQLQDEDWPKLTAAVNKLNAYEERLVIDDTSALSPAALRARARRAARRYGKPALIMVDYLQLMVCPGAENRNNEISEISRSLKALAKEMDCPVVALSQLNRSLEQRPNKRPINSDLRESGALEQDADVIMFVYRDEVYNAGTEMKGIAELILGKQRQGPIGSVRTAFIANQTRFANLAASTWQGGH